MPSTIDLELYLDTLPPEHEWGFRLHGLVLNLLKSKHLQLSGSIHNHSLNPFSVQIGNIRKERLKFKIILLQDDLLTQWKEMVEPGITFRADNSERGMSGHIISRNDNSESYQQLYDASIEAAAPKRVEIKFISPTAISTADQEWPVPIPRYIFRGLLRRWNAFSDKKFGEGFEEWLERHLTCPNYRVDPAIAELGKDNLRLIGFIGRATYELSGDPHQRRVLGLLSRYAEYANVGTRTGYGCGQVKVMIH